MRLPGGGEPVDLVLHIGQGKTGTTSIQRMLRLRRSELAAHGVLYPVSPGPERHTKLGLSFRSDAELPSQPAWRRMQAQSPDRFRRRVHRRLTREIETAALSRVVVSDEALYGLRAPSLERLRSFTETVARRVRVVVYLRRQDDHLVSLYQQQVKVGETRRLSDWAAGDRARIYDYAQRLRDWRDVVSPTEIVVRRFERSAFHEGSLEADFLRAAGLPALRLADRPATNESLDAETVEFLRVLNLYEAEERGEAPGLMDHRHLTDLLADHSGGPALSLPPDRLDAFMDRWREPNRWVAREFLGEPELFAERQARATTDRQHLDPARVDHFADLCEIPDGVRRHLRRIAEREAGA